LDFSKLNKMCNESRNGFSILLIHSMSSPLFPHQQLGVDQMEKSLHGGDFGVVIADDPGAGKTRMTVGLLQALGREAGPVLLIVPLSVLQHWQKEFTAMGWLAEDVGVYHPDQGATQLPSKRPWVTLTTYRVFEGHSLAREGPWPCIVFDEATVLKEPDSRVTVAARELGALASRRIMITGTPTQKNLSELHTLFSILQPDLLGDEMVFRSFFTEPVRNGTHSLALGADRLRAGRLLLVLETLIKPHILRRSVVKPFAKHSMVVWAPMREKEATLHAKALREIKTTCHYSREEAMSSVTGGTHSGYYETDGSGAPVCAKHDMVLALLKKALAGPTRSVAIFTRHLDLLDWVVHAVHLAHPGVGVGIVHGAVSSQNREEAVTAFNTGQTRVLVLTTRSSCYGINLRCETIIIAELDWNAAVDEQATARAHRGDSRCAVDVYFPLTGGTFEERKYKRQLQELTVNHKLLDGLTSGPGPGPGPGPAPLLIKLSDPTMSIESHDKTVQKLALGPQVFDETCRNYVAAHDRAQQQRKDQAVRLGAWICKRIIAALASGPKSTAYFSKHRQRCDFPKPLYRACLHRVARSRGGQWTLKA
jgi:SNF2 family DNA or RNA helicase